MFKKLVTLDFMKIIVCKIHPGGTKPYSYISHGLCGLFMIHILGHLYAEIFPYCNGLTAHEIILLPMF